MSTSTACRSVLRAWILALALLGFTDANVMAAPGDEVARIPLTSCTSAPLGLAFDGRILYYTQLTNPVKGRVYKVDAGTGLDLGSFQVMRGGSPFLEQLGGLAYDANRDLLWVGSTDRLYAVSLDLGEITTEYGVVRGVAAGGYDYTRDEIWVADGSPDGTKCWRPDSTPCGSLSGESNLGLTFDGIDIWHFTPNNLDPPGPPDEGVLYPTFGRIPTVDYSRAFVTPPSRDYRGLAYDCETFAVPVIWAGYVFTCELVAFEVAPRIGCSVASSPRVLRGATDAANRLAKLPLTSTNADRIVRKTLPFRYDDANALLPGWGELIFYRVVGPNDGPDPTVLKLIADHATNSAILTE